MDTCIEDGLVDEVYENTRFIRHYDFSVTPSFRMLAARFEWDNLGLLQARGRSYNGNETSPVVAIRVWEPVHEA
jgi:hypothetical protein